MNPVTASTTEQPLDSGTDGAETAQSEADTQAEENLSAASAEKESVTTSNEDQRVQTEETPADVAVPQAVEDERADQSLTEPTDKTKDMAIDQASRPNALTEPTSGTNTNPVCKVPKANKKDKAGQDGRKYVPSKKAMIDPLKMDMSNPRVSPLTCK